MLSFVAAGHLDKLQTGTVLGGELDPALAGLGHGIDRVGHHGPAGRELVYGDPVGHDVADRVVPERSQRGGSRRLDAVDAQEGRRKSVGDGAGQRRLARARQPSEDDRQRRRHPRPDAAVLPRAAAAYTMRFSAVSQSMATVSITRW
jgi:hypothetical protein